MRPADAVNAPLTYVFAFGPGWSEGDPERKDLLGGKGASLAAMSRAGFPVPPGFTISAECCGHVERHGAWPPGLGDEVRRAIARLEAATERAFGRGPRPLLVAVRSGAAVSMPGMMDTILNCGLNPSLIDTYPSPEAFWREYANHIRLFASSVAGLTLEFDEGRPAQPQAEEFLAAWSKLPERSMGLRSMRPGSPHGLEAHATPGGSFPTDPWDVLVQAIDAVFASWHSPRAQAYRQHHDVRGVPGTAVNVQAMFPSQRSGVLFTADPNVLDTGEMILEASYGLGEAVVSGAVTPDIYVLDRRTLEVRRHVAASLRDASESLSETRPRDEPALSGAQVREIGRLGQRVEEHFGVPSDIEWGLADGQLVLLQTRPIRGLDVLQEARRARDDEAARLRQLAGNSHVVWVVHNLAETLPAPTPLTWDVIHVFMSGRGGFGRLYRELGYRPSRAVDEDGFLELICGRIYADPRRAAGLFWGDLPLAYDTQAIVADPRTLEGPPRKLDLQRADPLLFLRLPGLVWSMVRCARRMKRLRSRVIERFDEWTVPQCGRSPQDDDRPPAARFRKFLASAAEQDIGSLDDAQLLAEFHRRREYVLGELAAESLLPGFFAGLAQAELTLWLTRLLGEEAPSWVARLTSGLDGDPTVEQNAELYRVARGEASLGPFLVRFGHRADNEMELAHPRWREDSAFVERLVSSLRASEAVSPLQRHEEQVQMRREAEADLPRVLADYGGSSFREDIEHLVRETGRLLPYREKGKFYLMHGYETLRRPLVELARRWELGRDLFFLRLAELPQFSARRSELMDEIERRKLRWKAQQKLTLGEVIDSQRLEALGHAAPREGSAPGQRLPARPIASGVATGIARVVFDPGQPRDLGNGYILVCPSTDPGWTPLFLQAKGLVVERGGVLSHGAIVARDFGIPAVVYEHATRHIRDGTRIAIDGHRGEIVLEAGG
jgi:pyruvate,water dikinase